jgi:hypothetical protein
MGAPSTAAVPTEGDSLHDWSVAAMCTVITLWCTIFRIAFTAATDNFWTVSPSIDLSAQSAGRLGAC